MIDAALFAFAAVFYVALCARSLRAAWASGASAPPSAMFVMLALTVAIRLVLTAPSFVHANFHGMSLVDSALAFPASPSHRPEYGLVGFAALGAVAHALGGRLEHVMLANVAFGSCACVALAACVRSIAGRDAAFFVTAGLAACSPPLARLAHSEDVHNVGVLFFATAWYALDRYLVARRREDFVLAVVSALAMVGSRQTFYVLIPVLCLHVVSRVGLRGALRQPLASGVALVAAATFVRVASSLLEPGDRTTYRFALDLLRIDGVLAALVRHHVLVDGARFGYGLPVLVFAAVAVCTSRRGAPRALVVAFAIAVGATIPFGFPIPGVEYAFRLPVHILVCVLPGVAVGVLSERPGAARALCGLAGLAVCTSMASPQFRALRTSSPDYLEATYLASNLHRIAQGGRIWVPLPAGRAPAFALGRFLLDDRPDVHIVHERPAATVPTYVVLGARCYGYSYEEFGAPGARRGGRPDADAVRRFVQGVYDQDLAGAGTRPPAHPRPSCTALETQSVDVAPRVRIVPVDDLPFVAYRGPYPLRLVRLVPPSETPGEPTDPTFDQ